ncbi:MAG: HAD hydrolase-like protein [Elusimicrobiota bacterium]|jgi:phosphoglycolate phosphatase-like HAD superfamily hydrolase|nr:HAD hydrolase-like protein [Elusimicrobiota bacterium]
MKLVLFDLDGTLLDMGLYGVISLNKAIKNLYGKEPKYDHAFLAGKTDTHNFNYVFKETFKKNPTPKQFAALKAEYLKLLPLEAKGKKTKVISGVEAFLKKLSAIKEVKLALATGNFEEAARIKLAPSGLNKYFTTGGFGDKAPNRPAMLLEAVKNAQKQFKAKFKEGDVYVIGDTASDITAAKENGFHNAVVDEAGLGDREKLLRAAAELHEKNFKNIKLWLMWLGLAADPKGVEKGSYIMPASAIEHVFFSRTGIDEQRLKMFRIKKYSDLESGTLL